MIERAAQYRERGYANPFDCPDARAHSSYHGLHQGGLLRLPEKSAPASPFTELTHRAFREFVLEETFSCLGARSAIRRGTYRFGAYARLDAAAVTQGLARDLFAFAAERGGFASEFTTFVAVFRKCRRLSEEEFERALWSQLQRLHDVDARHHSWDPRVSDEPSDQRFSFSVAGNAFFVVGLHPRASRAARRFAWPALVFNAHEQFERLRANGRFAGLQRQIRARERQLSGNLNPNLADYGGHSEARQYSGRPNGEMWTCPFKPHR